MSQATQMKLEDLLSVNEVVLLAMEKASVEPLPADSGLRRLRGMKYFFPRWLDKERWAALLPLMFTTAIVWGFRGEGEGWCYEDRWCYHEPVVALAALKAWDGEGDPAGWHRHPQSGRRRNEKGEEWVAR